MNLEDIRRQINIIDKQILEKLNQRFSLSIQAKKFKSKIKDLERETQVMGQIKKETKGFDCMREKFAKKIFKKIIHESRRIQKMNQKEES